MPRIRGDVERSGREPKGNAHVAETQLLGQPADHRRPVRLRYRRTARVRKTSWYSFGAGSSPARPTRP